MNPVNGIVSLVAQGRTRHGLSIVIKKNGIGGIEWTTWNLQGAIRGAQGDLAHCDSIVQLFICFLPFALLSPQQAF